MMDSLGRKRHSLRLFASLAGCLLGIGNVLGAQEFKVNDFVYAMSHLFPDEYARNTGLTIFPILSLPFGGDQTAMANAYTAVCRDISFLEANPAAAELVVGQVERLCGVAGGRSVGRAAGSDTADAGGPENRRSTWPFPKGKNRKAGCACAGRI